MPGTAFRDSKRVPHALRLERQGLLTSVPIAGICPPPCAWSRKRASSFDRSHASSPPVRALRCFDRPDVAIRGGIPHQYHVLRSIHLGTLCSGWDSESLTGKRNKCCGLAGRQCKVRTSGIADDQLYLPGQIVDLQVDHAIALEGIHLPSGIGADVCGGRVGLTKACLRNCGTCQGTAVVVPPPFITREYRSCGEQCCPGHNTNKYGSHNDLLVGMRANNLETIVASSRHNKVIDG